MLETANVYTYQFGAEVCVFAAKFSKFFVDVSELSKIDLRISAGSL